VVFCRGISFISHILMQPSQSCSICPSVFTISHPRHGLSTETKPNDFCHFALAEKKKPVA
jgi:hypothetical protein